jgi:hypothetical protein
VNANPISEPGARALADAINQASIRQHSAEALKSVDMALARAPQQPLVVNAAADPRVREQACRRLRPT